MRNHGRSNASDILMPSSSEIEQNFSDVLENANNNY